MPLIVLLVVLVAATAGAAAPAELAPARGLAQTPTLPAAPPGSGLTPLPDAPRPAVTPTPVKPERIVVGPTPTATLAERQPPLRDIPLSLVATGDQVARGMQTSLNFYFPGPGDWLLADQGSFLFLEFDHSPLLDNRFSTVTISLNNSPLTSARLDRANQSRTAWRIELPRDKLRTDINHFQLWYDMGLEGDFQCTSWDSYALYSTVYSESYLHYEYARPLTYVLPPPPDLARFPEPFLRLSKPAAKIAFVVPAAPSAFELGAAASVAARLAQVSGGRLVNTTLYLADDVEPSLLTGTDLVLVGRPANNPWLAAIRQTLPIKPGEVAGRQVWLSEPGRPLSSDVGLLQVVRSPYDPRHAVLVVSGESDEGVRRAGRTMSSSLALKSLQGQYAILNVAKDELRQGEDVTLPGEVPAFSLAQTGFSDALVTGPGKHTIGISFDAPVVDRRQGMYFDTVISYSPLVDHNRSSVTVTINGTPVDSAILASTDEVLVKRRVRIAAEQVRPGINTLAVNFNLYTPYAPECGALAPERLWAVLNAASEVLLPYTTGRLPLNLANWPYPFVANGALSETMLVLPDDRDQLRDALQLATALGRQSMRGSTELRATLASAGPSDEEKRRYDLIAFGLSTSNGLIAAASSALPLALDESLKRSLQRPALVLLGVEDAASLGILELVPSPWNEERALLVVSGTSPEAVRLAPPMLNSKLPAGSLATQAALAAPVGIELATEEARTGEARRRLPLGILVLLPIGAVVVAGLSLLVYRTTERTTERRGSQ